MKTDKQIEAGFADWWQGFIGEAKLPSEWQDFAYAGYKAAIAATHEQYKPLVEALIETSKQLSAWSFQWRDADRAAWDSAQQALANLSEELR